MKRLFSHILILITGIALLMSCADDTFTKEGLTGEQVGLKLALNLPGGGSASTRMGGTDANTDTEEGQGFENLIQSTDIRLLIFSNNIFQEEVTGLQITGLETSSVRFLEGKTANPYEGNVEIVVFTNLKSSGLTPLTEEFKGKTVEEIYRMCNYVYGEKEWALSSDRRIPMWGSLSMYLKKGEVNRGNIDLYRAVAKVNLLVNEGRGLDEFSLSSVWVYFANTEGYCAPLPSDATVESIETQFTKTSIPSSSAQRSGPLTYTLEEGANVFQNHIYIPESNNKVPEENKKKLCLVVGGHYKGEGLVEPGEESFYRIDFKDNLESGNNEDLRVYDVIRNHSYQFNIRSVKNPGTTTPEEALDNVVVGMDVVITAWVDEPMRGIPDQYTLTTDKSRVTFTQKSATEKVEVWTDYGPTENNWELADVPTNSWFTVVKEGPDHVSITAEENHGVSRNGSFCVQAGNLKKQIIVYQNQPPTANCYVVGDGEHELIVTIKGNGNDGVYANSDKGLGNVKLVESNQDDASIKPDKIGIIWETQAGLIMLKDKEGNSVSSGNGKFATYDTGKGIIKYEVNSTGATIGGVRGGNALIGAFTNNGTLLWSWHIWVCPDMVESEGAIREEYIQHWKINGYYVMDRNLGALDNKPGVASLGLLYQWGRKDPFIGAKVTNDDYRDTGVLPTEIYYGSWGVSKNDEETPMTIPETILHPTTLTKAGMSKGSDNRKALLWGTDGGLNTTGVKDLGTKTIYDPCPMGYRVPPVDAFVFETKRVPKSYTKKDETLTDGRYQFNYNTYTPTKWESYNKSSEKLNWNENLIYVPHYETKRTWDDDLHMSYYSGDYIKNAEFYGFYLNYSEIIEPQVTQDFKKDSNNRYYFYKPKNTANLTWLPLSGAYNPHNKKTELTFKSVTVEQGSSITVNSFLWTNSSVTSADKQLIPAAMFLHGTETGGGGSGRHIHGLTKSDIRAEPHYAGAVRCVRDVQKDFSESNKVPSDILLGKNIGSTVIAKVYSINDTWKVVDAGAPWFKISPDRGSADKGRGTDITITALQTNDTGSDRTATVLIQFSQEKILRSFKVTQTRR